MINNKLLSIKENICCILFVYTVFAQAHVVFIDKYPLLTIIPYPILILYSLFFNKVYTKRHINAVSVFFIALLYMQLRSSTFSLTFWVYPAIISLFLLLKRNIILKIFECFINILTIILILGLSFWLVSVVTGYSINIGSCTIGNRFYELYPFYVVEPNSGIMEFLLHRFNSIFDEPGMLGTICVLILCAKKFDFSNDKRLYIILLGGIFSMSLAFYALCILYILLSAKFSSKYFIGIFIFVILFLILNYLFDNIIYEHFNDRLNVSDVSDLDNRTSGAFEFEFNKFLNSSNVIYGMGHNAHVGIGTSEGIKAYFFNYGYVGLFLLLVGFICIIQSFKLKANYVFIFIYVLNFYQRAGIYRLYMLLPFVAALILSNNKNGNK